jgi:hypothetical protein
MDEECSTHDGWKYRTNICSKNLKRRIYSRRRRLEDNIKTGVSKAACYCVSWLKFYSGGLYGKWLIINIVCSEQTSDVRSLCCLQCRHCYCNVASSVAQTPWTCLLCRSVCRKLRPQWFAASWNWCASSWTNHYIAYADSLFRTSRVENVSYKANDYRKLNGIFCLVLIRTLNQADCPRGALRTENAAHRGLERNWYNIDVLLLGNYSKCNVGLPRCTYHVTYIVKKATAHVVETSADSILCLPDCWLKVCVHPEGPAAGHLDTSFLGLPVSSSGKCWDCSPRAACFCILLAQPVRFSVL